MQRLQQLRQCADMLVHWHWRSHVPTDIEAQGLVVSSRTRGTNGVCSEQKLDMNLCVTCARHGRSSTCIYDQQWSSMSFSLSQSAWELKPCRKPKLLARHRHQAHRKACEAHFQRIFRNRRMAFCFCCMAMGHRWAY